MLAFLGRFGRAEDFFVKAVEDESPPPLCLHQMGMPENLEMVRDGDHLGIEQFGEFTDTFRT